MVAAPSRTRQRVRRRPRGTGCGGRAACSTARTAASPLRGSTGAAADPWAWPASASSHGLGSRPVRRPFTVRCRAHERWSSSSARPRATWSRRRSSATAAGAFAQEIGTRPSSNPVTKTTRHSSPLARWKVSKSTAWPAALLVPRREVEPRDEAGDAAGAAFGREIVAAESQQRVTMLTQLFVRSGRPALGRRGRGRLVVGPWLRFRRDLAREIGQQLRERAAARFSLGRAQLVEQRADRRSLDESSTGGDPARDAPAGERGFEQRRLRIGAEQHSHRGPRHARRERFPASLRDCRRFRAVVGVRERRRSRAARPHRDDLRSHAGDVGCEDRLGDGHDLRRRAVVAVERDDGGAREMLGERQQRCCIRAREAVDRLCRIADDAEVGARTEPGTEQPELQRCGVLELVDEHVPEAPALGGRERRVLPDRVRAQPEQVVEVVGALAALLAFVAGVDAGDIVEGSGRPAAGRARRGRVQLGPHEAGLGPLDLGREVGERGRGDRPRAAIPGEWPEDACLRGEHGGHRTVLLERAPPQLREGQRVERPGGDARDAEPGDPVDELARGLAGERDREHVARFDRTLSRAERDAAREDARLARTGRCEDREGVRGCRDRVAFGARRARRAAGPSGAHGRPHRGQEREKAPSSLRCVCSSELLGAVPRPTL